MIVVDTNVIASLYLETDRTEVAEQVLIKDSDWVVPLLWRSEFRNVLAIWVRHQRMRLAEAVQVVESAETQLRGQEFEVPSTHVLRLADASDCSAYDCEFVALAEDLRVPMVTLDKQVLGSFPQIALSPRDFAA